MLTIHVQWSSIRRLVINCHDHLRLFVFLLAKQIYLHHGVAKKFGVSKLQICPPLSNMGRVKEKGFRISEFKKILVM